MGNPSKKPLSKRKLSVIRSEMTDAHSDFEGALLRRALYKTSDTEVSQDLVQTTFLKTLLYLQKGGKIDLMRSFLNHVLGDLIVDEYRSRNSKTVSLDVLMDTGFEPHVYDFEKSLSVLDSRAIILLVPQLPEKYELVIRLRYLRGLSLKEIADSTDQSENTVAVQVHRGLTKLRKLCEANSLL